MGLLRSQWLVGAAAIAMSAGAAVAQTVPSPSQGGAQFASDAGSSDGIESVVVTARKRSERLIDVPAAITVMGDDLHDQLVLDKTSDYLRQVPGAQLVNSGPEYLDDISIRGQGSGRLAFSESATGLFRDGMYAAGGGFGGNSLSRMDFLDDERVEVMRGPQGALFGRNSVGGAINVLFHQPDDAWSESATARYQEPNRVDFEGVLNAPLDDGFAIRASGLISNQSGGFIRDVDTGKAVDAEHQTGARVIVAKSFGSLIETSLLWQYDDSRAPSFADLGDRATRIDGTVLDPGPYKRADLNRIGVVSTTENYGQFTGVGHLPWADLTIKASYTHRDGGRANDDGDHFNGTSDIDVAPGPSVLFIDTAGFQTAAYDQGATQMYLASRDGARVKWLVGAEAILSTDHVDTDPQDCPAYTGKVQPLVPGCIVGLAGSFTPLTAAGSLISARARLTSQLGVNHDIFQEDLDSYSLFGSTEVKLARDLTFDAELRVQTDEKHFSFMRYSEDPLVYFGTGPIPAGLMAPITIDPDGAAGPLKAQPVEFCPPTVANCAPGLQTATVHARRQWTMWTPAATLKWAFADDEMTYLRFATGYRPGGYNTNLAPTTVRSQLTTNLLYNPEMAYSYELGWKGSLLDGFLHGSADVYYMWTNNVQIVSAPSVTSIGLVLQNSGDAHVYGFESELDHTQDLWHGHLTTDLSFSSEGGAFEKGATSLSDLNGDGIPELVDLNGKQVPNLRDYQIAIGISYSHSLSGTLNGFVSVDDQIAHGGYQNAPNTIKDAGYNLLDARLGIEAENWRLSVFGRNLTNVAYVTNDVQTTQYWNQPRTLGVEFTLRN